ncbi:PTS system, mannose-specific IIB component [Pediococcus damnosus]|uniref:PTS system, mannose-specific IIB component n=1 Tax=Pediococcus damnosus TaxID=51663 RepID=A0A0R2HTD3_9LACO|nr:PTS sugar transporter subunit IIA [Pediococcus damnosus]AMV60964.1 PTS system, mannose-specific IIB component [Pediococcus damnosus]AMV63537.1 PTS system, mannose-specific IIB component [Pediococcus damnosus]AMV65324.1 PTS system, mannose-specific IIB component [Pediococcus damnosus]AMV66524.1 PTS system, mannose-specific IIB component [Pediococcus damnosus]AMV68829.1 PTS system, mannose-specific IIB component [Pediococcus damnosus]
MKLLLMSHGNMATEALKSAEMIMGPIKDTAAVGLQPNQGPEDLQAAAEKFISDNPNHEPVVVIVDLLGGTPSNVVVRLIAAHPDLQVVSGLNLPMVINYGNQIMMGDEFSKTTMMDEAKAGVIDVNAKLNE